MHHSAHPDHAHHDLDLIAGHAAGDLSNLDTASAKSLLSSCATCAEVHRDLLAISTATRDLPRTTRAPRDFRLTAEQAERLRSGSWLRKLLRPFGSARSATRPMARAFTSLGVAGVLVAVLVPAIVGGLGGAASAPAQQEGTDFGGPAATYAPAMAPGAAGAPSVKNDVAVDAEATQMVLAAGESTDVRDGDVEIQVGDDRLMAAAPSNPLLIGSIALLVLGIALFGLRFAARRLR